eukprot:CAMPEP_0171131800 /NCGR_PEP_ID=MMETSP0766_2-20121228/123387_1 /TAXON_ID=439317 /ORGANISM="Gambierdiscus australes, Strain CAWD 149" /LENGTH=63 /DNA_ID=CAMNT_0011595115 /DNA_START=486 /DNA_END=677 /DNA_ORIENTATION=-
MSSSWPLTPKTVGTMGRAETLGRSVKFPSTTESSTMNIGNTGPGLHDAVGGSMNSHGMVKELG